MLNVKQKAEEAGSSQLDVAIKRGVLVRIRVQDPHGIFSRANSSPTFQHAALPELTVGVLRGRSFRSAEHLSDDITGHDYQIAVPTGEPLSVWVHTRYFNLADSRGVPIPATGTVATFQAAPGIDQSFTIQITGALANVRP